MNLRPAESTARLHAAVRPRLVFLLLLVVPMLLSAEPRTALVIGNADYESARLANPVNDANDIAAKLRELGFEVIHHVDLDRAGMRMAIREFEARLRDNGGVGLFYYAGHGVQINGRNYLVPVRANIEREYEVEDASIDARLVLGAMELARSNVNIVILDACRNNPFRSFRSLSQGLAQMEGPTGSLIAYSTAPGSVAADGEGRNSPYVEQLLLEMDRPGIPIEQMFKRVRVGVKRTMNDRQIPWETSSLTGDFQFVPAAGAEQTLSENPPHPAVADREVEMQFWDSVKDSGDTEALDAYIQRYPNGEFVALARIARERLQATSQASGGPVDAAVVGTWELDVTGTLGVSHWVQSINADATFDFYATGPSSPPVQHGAFTASNGKWTINSPAINWIDGGTYELYDPDTLALSGKLGTAVWTRREQ